MPPKKNDTIQESDADVLFAASVLTNMKSTTEFAQSPKSRAFTYKKPETSPSKEVMSLQAGEEAMHSSRLLASILREKVGNVRGKGGDGSRK